VGSEGQFNQAGSESGVSATPICKRPMPRERHTRFQAATPEFGNVRLSKLGGHGQDSGCGLSGQFPPARAGRLTPSLRSQRAPGQATHPT
jgi:hypothetical protein